MSHLDTSYKLGAARAQFDFNDWMSQGIDDPAAAPPKRYSTFDSGKAVKVALVKLSASKQRASRTPIGKGGRFTALKKKLAKKKKTKR